jgi:hypothetical protein
MPLESVLATEPMLDKILICYDPESGDETEKLAKAIEDKFPSKTYLVPFVWPSNVAGDGSRIGIATQYGLEQVRTSYVVNVQGDEVWPTELVDVVKENFPIWATKGIEGVRFKVLHLEHNAQFYQGDDRNFWFDEQPHQPSTWNFQSGAGYNVAIKLFKRCPKIKMSHDAWSVENVALLHHCQTSDVHPIVHLHDFFRDSLVDLRQNAAKEIWTDQSKFGNYAVTANAIEESKAKWFDNPLWSKTDSPFIEYINPIARQLLGNLSYKVRWSLLE